MLYTLDFIQYVLLLHSYCTGTYLARPLVAATVFLIPRLSLSAVLRLMCPAHDLKIADYRVLWCTQHT